MFSQSSFCYSKNTFFQVARILYGSVPWVLGEHTNLMFSAVCFSMHLLAVVLYQFACAFVINKIVKAFNRLFALGKHFMIEEYDSNGKGGNEKQV